MNVMKRIISIILGLVILISMIGCTGKRDSAITDTRIENDSIIGTEVNNVKYSTINDANILSNSVLRFELGDISEEGEIDSYSSFRTIEYLPKDVFLKVEFVKEYEIGVYLYEKKGDSYIYRSNKIFNDSFSSKDIDNLDGDYVRLVVISGAVNADANTFDNEVLSKLNLKVFRSDGTEYIIFLPGTILKTDGIISSVKAHSMYTPDYIAIEEGVAVAVEKYQIDWYAYSYSEDNDRYTFCGSSSSHITNGSFELVNVKKEYPEATHIRLQLIWADGGSTINQDAVTDSGISCFKNVIDYDNYDIGTIASEDGQNNKNRADRFYVPDYFSIDDYDAVTVGTGYNITWFAYSQENGRYIFKGTSGWLGDGSYFTIKSILRKYPDANFFRYAVNSTTGFDIQSEVQLEEEVQNSQVHIYAESDNLNFYFGKIIDENETGMEHSVGDIIDCSQKEKNKLSNISYIDIEQIKVLSIADNYSTEIYMYNEKFEYLGKSPKYSAAAELKLADFLIDYPDLRYIRFSIEGSYDVLDFTTIEEILNMFDLKTKDIKTSTFEYCINDERRNERVGFEQIGNVGKFQDGATYEDYYIQMGSSNKGFIYDVKSFDKIATVNLDGVVSIHSNSVCFGMDKFAVKDDFPLLYCNVYNNYSADEDRREGTCGVFRLVRDGEGNYQGKLVQLIKIGFTEDLSLWKSKEDGTDYRPYGNFVVDTDKNKLYVYVMRDKEHITRFFEFECPAIDITGNDLEIVLEETDIISSFDLDYYSAIQGVTYLNGMLYSLDGFENAALHVIDLEKQCLHATINLSAMGMAYEPEAITSIDNSIIFVNSTGNVHKIIMDYK